MMGFHLRRPGFWKTAAAVGGVGGALAGLMQPAEAQTPPANACAVSGASCGFAISETKLQKMTPLFKLQAQISQAKIPVGEAVFATLIVNVISGNSTKCSEPFTDTRVRSGVLNLEIGRNMTCGGSTFEDIIGKYNDLSFQVCIGDAAAGNCLKPIQMGSVPYAIKSNYAVTAQNAYQAETASRANYARRLTTDGGMLDSGSLGAGYFDMQSPDKGAPGTGSSLALWNETLKYNPQSVVFPVGGFINWWGSDGTQQINFASKNTDTLDLEPLQFLNFYAKHTTFVGAMEIFDNANFWSRGSFAKGFSVGMNPSGTPSPVLSTSSLDGKTTLYKSTELKDNVTFTGAGKTISFGSATISPKPIVDLTNADVRLPSTTTAAPAISLQTRQITAFASRNPGVQGAPLTAKFCAVTQQETNTEPVPDENLSVRGICYTTPSTTTPGQWTFYAQLANCTFTCF